MITRPGSRIRLEGAMTALVTPFHNGEVDWDRLDALVDRQIEGGTDWLVPCGTTGEAPTLSDVERRGIIERVITRSAVTPNANSLAGSRSTWYCLTYPPTLATSATPGTL